jgi:hypothetical protein
VIAAMRADSEGSGGGERPPWADGSVPLRREGEAAERALRIEVLLARRRRARRARRARVAVAGGIGAVMLGGVVLVGANLTTGTKSVSGKLVIAPRPEPARAAHPPVARIGPAVALVRAGGAKRGAPVAAPEASVPEAPEAGAPTPEPIYVAPEPESPPEAAPPTREPAPRTPPDASKEFGFEH